MLIIILALLLFGFLQSIFELHKDNDAQQKKKIEKILSIIYIVVFVLGGVVAISQNYDDDNLNSDIATITKSVNKIDTNYSKVSDQLKKTLSDSKSLIQKVGIMNSSLDCLLTVRSVLVKQTVDINKKLQKQIDYDNKNLLDKEATVALMDYNISVDTTNNSSRSVELCLTNFGKRNAIVKNGRGYILFFDERNELITSINIPGNNIESIVQPHDIAGMRFCYYSDGILRLDDLKSKSSFIILCLQVNYADQLYKINRQKKFYFKWHTNDDKFGGPKDWQANFAKIWEKQNSYFE